MATFAELTDALDKGSPESLGAIKLAAWEGMAGGHLPKPLFDILLQYDGGNLDPGYFMTFTNPAFEDEFQSVHLGRILGIGGHPHGSIKRLTQWLEDIEFAMSDVPASLFIFGDDWDGNAITFDMESRAIGFIDIETAGDDFSDPETYVEIARNFDSFLTELKAVE